MDIKDFYLLVLRHLKLVTLCVILGITASVAITSYQTPFYKSEIQLFVSTESSAVDLSALIQGSSFSQQRVKSYAQIMNSPTTLKPVVEALALPYSAEILASRVKATAPLDTVLINVSVEDTDPTRAANIADLIGATFSQYVNEIESSGQNSINPIKVSVVKNAQVASKPSTPKKELNYLLGIIIGFGFGIAIAILRQIFENSVKNEDDLNGATLLGTIGFDRSAKNKPLISQISRYSPRVESFRQLRTNLEYLNKENPPKVIAITSALPGEGKTTTSINLSLSLANTGFEVLLIEADLRKPKISKYFSNINSNFGLVDLLSPEGENDVKSLLARAILKVGKENKISFIPAGKIPGNPAELLNSSNFTSLLALLKEEFHFIIVDCPPGLPVADASIIATQCDGALLVVEASKTKINQLNGVRQSIENVGGKVIGVVINKIPRTRLYDDYGYKYGYGYGYKGAYGYRGRRGNYSGYAPESER